MATWGVLRARVILLCAISGAIADPKSLAFAEEPGRWYLGVDVGGNFQHDITIRAMDLGGPFSFGLQFDPGARLDLRTGYQFQPCWAIEVETGVSYNSVSKVEWLQGTGSDDGSDLYQVPILASLVFSHHIGGSWFVRFGGGVGGVFSRLDSGMHLARNFYNPYDWVSGTDTDFQLGYQGMAAVDYAVSRRLSVGLRYEFLGTTSHEWTIGGITGNADPTLSHSIMASLTYHFR